MLGGVEVGGTVAVEGNGGSEGGSCELGAILKSEVGIGREMGVKTGETRSPSLCEVFIFFLGEHLVGCFGFGFDLALGLGGGGGISSWSELSSMISSITGGGFGFCFAFLCCERTFARSDISDAKRSSPIAGIPLTPRPPEVPPSLLGATLESFSIVESDGTARWSVAFRLKIGLGLGRDFGAPGATEEELVEVWISEVGLVEGVVAEMEETLWLDEVSAGSRKAPVSLYAGRDFGGGFRGRLVDVAVAIESDAVGKIALEVRRRRDVVVP